jgi:bisphosphoglycerate-dependent phosphoglycerate mutase
MVGHRDLFLAVIKRVEGLSSKAMMNRNVFQNDRPLVYPFDSERRIIDSGLLAS